MVCGESLKCETGWLHSAVAHLIIDFITKDWVAAESLGQILPHPKIERSSSEFPASSVFKIMGQCDN